MLRVTVERDIDYYGFEHREKWAGQFNDGVWEFSVDVLRSGSKSLFKKHTVPHSAVPDDVWEAVQTVIEGARDTGLDPVDVEELDQ